MCVPVSGTECFRAPRGDFAVADGEAPGEAQKRTSDALVFAETTKEAVGDPVHVADRISRWRVKQTREKAEEHEGVRYAPERLERIHLERLPAGTAVGRAHELNPSQRRGVPARRVADGGAAVGKASRGRPASQRLGACVHGYGDGHMPWRTGQPERQPHGRTVKAPALVRWPAGAHLEIAPFAQRPLAAAARRRLSLGVRGRASGGARRHGAEGRWRASSIRYWGPGVMAWDRSARRGRGRAGTRSTRVPRWPKRL